MYKTLSTFLNVLMNLFFPINFFDKFYFTYLKMSKNPPAKYYQDNKERLQKKSLERYQTLSKE